MELCKGGTISEAKDGNPIDEITCAKYIKQIAMALLYCHERNIIHSDIKPANIMLDEDKKNIKLIDFGVSVRHNPNQLKNLAGSVRYMAPEVFEYNYDFKADIWSLGITLVFLLSGKHPWGSPKSTLDEMKRLI